MPAPRRRRQPPVQPSLLDWIAPEPFPEEAVRASSLAGRISRAVAQALRDSPLSRAEIAKRMGAYLGEDVSVSILDAYASQARDQHNISAVRLAGLVHATGDARLLDLLAAPFGFAVIDRRQLSLLELAETHEEMEALRRRQDALRKSVRSGGR